VTCVLIVPACKRPDEVRDFGVDWRGETFRFHQPGAEYNTGDHLRPVEATGFEYVVSGNGQTSEVKEVKFPRVLSGTVVDGSITLTAVDITTQGLLRTISASVWTPEDPALTIVSSDIINTAGRQITTVKISGGADGETWDVVNHVTFSDGVELDVILRITIEDEAD